MHQTTTSTRLVDLATARTLANIAERALTLFTKDGYRAKPFENNPAMFFVFPPDPTKPVYIVDTRDGRKHCTCKAFADYETCKHLLGCMTKIEDDRRADEAEEFAAYGRYDFEDNAEQRDDRPTIAAGYDCLGRLQPA